jgi:hypothetical protein
VIYQSEQIAVPSHYSTEAEETSGPENHQTRAGQAPDCGERFQTPDEIRYIQRRAAEQDARWVTVGPLALFSTESAHAWLLDPADHLAVRVAREGDPEPVHFEETETNFTIECMGNYRIDGELFVYTDRNSARVVSVFGYPTPASPHSVDLETSNMFG